eukprot:c621_g1_i1.p1 GENE.c621_g1_i1~~c621_g1_i1.p1  ORF type:complete len:325 (-),score=82.58 c621_g1_i1:102-986(-)
MENGIELQPMSTNLSKLIREDERSRVKFYSFFNLCLFGRVFKNEFALKNFSFSGETTQYQVNWVRDLATSQKGFFSSWLTFFIFRCICTSFIGAVFIWSLIDFDENGILYSWPYYLTEWTNAILFISFVCATFTTLKAKKLVESGENPYEVPFHARLTWFMRDVTFPAMFIVVVLYWGFVFNPSRTPTSLQVFQHGVNFIPPILEFYLAPAPSLYFHTFYFYLFCVLYILWTYIYYVAELDIGGRRYIYKILDWGSPRATGIVVGIGLIIGIPLLNLVRWWLLYIRKAIALQSN